MLLLVLFTLLICIYPTLVFFDIEVSKEIPELFEYSMRNINILVFSALFFALSLAYFRKTTHLIFAFIASLVLAYFLSEFVPVLFLYTGLFLPTLIHVYVFTLLFMLYGAKKSKSKYGFISVGLLLISPIIIYFLPVDLINHAVTSKTLEVFTESGMSYLSLLLAKFSGIEGTEGSGFLTESVLKAQVFIAFAYTYHYLNWFSKTSIIGWQKGMSKLKMVFIIVICTVSISLYYYDYLTGLIALLFLSYLHVFLEFPLNIVSIKGIFSKNTSGS